ncbi:MAG: hypothetical protein HFH85_17055 [Lachnospiraceae bacterium]|jgi:uncharacterized membrane protein YkoI|nr:hypothetical protein [Lachnospiraceae bacterium]
MKRLIMNQKRDSGMLRKGAAAAVFAAAIVSAAGCGNSVMDRNGALDLALADAGLAAEEITLTRQELEREGGKPYYEIAFTSGGYDYQYEIDASSGAVTEVSINALPAGGHVGAQQGQDVGRSGSVQDQGSGESGMQPDSVQSQGIGETGVQGQGSGESGVQPGSEQSQESGETGGASGGQQGQGNGQSGSGQPQGGAQPGNQSSLYVDTMDSAKSIALADAGLTESDVTFTKEKLDWDDGVAVYDIDFFTADMEYEYEIDAATGVIMDKSAEAFRNPGTVGTDTLIGEDEAKEIAVTHAGFTTTEVFFTKIKLEKEHGYTEYEIEFYKDRVEYEYTIDASTGAVLEYDSEYGD